MAREVNLQISDWTAVGTNASIPRYSVTLTTQWVDNAGTPHTDTRTVTFPNVLSGVPPSRLRAYMEMIALAEIRLLLGVDGG
jgi:hypothetical protein